jgi:S-DNA-T family DNA segregation ATPase FtsK/SpoIIIE
VRSAWVKFWDKRKEHRQSRKQARAEARERRLRRKEQSAKDKPDTTPPPPQRQRQDLRPDSNKSRTIVGTVNDMFRPPSTESTPAQSVETISPPQTDLTDTEPEPADVAFSIVKPAEEKHADIDRRKLSYQVRDYPYEFPSVDLLEDEEVSDGQVDYEDLEDKKQVVLDKLGDHNIELRDIEAIVGPTVTLFELKPKPGIKISQIKSLENDLAMALAARGIRMIAPIPGKSAVGLEIPNKHRELVRIRSVITTERFRDSRMELPVILGKTIQNEVYMADLTKMPHLLIAGATGSGKSVGLNCLIITLLYACHPSDLKFVMIDPKKIELQQYANILDHYIAMPEDAEEPITTDFAHALGLLKSCIKEMEQRYDLLSSAGVRSIKEYNERLKEGRIEENGIHRHLPHLVIVVDELADLMMTAGKEIEGPIARLAQMARAVGLHLVVATQRPSVNVITGLIKANFPSRIAYQVATGIDSRTIIDQYGAEQLVGNGDMLFMSGSQLLRLQSPYISLDEVEDVTRHVGAQEGPGPYVLPSTEDPGTGTDTLPGENTESGDRDELFDEAAHIIVRSQQGSVSLLQRKLSVGYTRAARIVDQLEDAGIVGPFEGSKARQVLIPDELELESFLKNRPV